MTHSRKQVRDSVVNLLTFASAPWNRAYPQRDAPQRVVYPYILVYTPNEQSRPLTMGVPYTVERNVTLITQAHLRISGAEEIEDKFDDVAAEVEKKLTYEFLAGEIKRLVGISLVSTESDIVVNAEQERLYGELTLTWNVSYHTEEGNPEIFK